MSQTQSFYDELFVTENIVNVLLPDAWHEIKQNSFTYLFATHEDTVVGFQFQSEHGYWISGPISSLLAIRNKQ